MYEQRVSRDSLVYLWTWQGRENYKHEYETVPTNFNAEAFLFFMTIKKTSHAAITFWSFLSRLIPMIIDLEFVYSKRYCKKQILWSFSEFFFFLKRNCTLSHFLKWKNIYILQSQNVKTTNLNFMLLVSFKVQGIRIFFNFWYKWLIFSKWLSHVCSQ